MFFFGGGGGGGEVRSGDRAAGSQSRRSFLMIFHYCTGLLLTPSIGKSSNFFFNILMIKQNANSQDCLNH